MIAVLSMVWKSTDISSSTGFVKATVKFAVPASSSTSKPVTERTAVSSSFIVEVAVAVPIDIICPLAFIRAIVPVKVSCGSQVLSPTTETGISTLLLPGSIVYSTLVWATKSLVVFALPSVVEKRIITGSCATLSMVATKL